MSQAVRWYIIQTYSGYENAVKVDLERRVESMGMSDFIFRIIVPEETVIEKKADGKEKEKIKQLFPGYVFVEMMVTDESWFVVRNTPRVTGFLGSSGGGTKPVPLAPDEINQILLKIGVISKPTFDHLLGKQVEVIEGTWIGLKGEVVDIDNDQEKVVVDLDLFGRATPTEFDANQLKEL
ncbi:MAG: transcription termination/antitermination factor NusG [Tenericutes bacterium HGW-Tenericutes-3]|nr:MAG: transcription termination/antitermination factor NusG [Tenericutes bacterium HGW-Tenericutes-3]